MSIDAGSVYSAIEIKMDNLAKQVNDAKRQFDRLEKGATESAKKGEVSFSKMFLSIATGQAAVQLATKAMNFLVTSIKDSIKASVAAQEVISKYGVVFDGMGTAAEDAANTFAKSFDLAGSTAKEMLSNTGNLLQGMGATKEESLALSLQVNTLASDLASFTNNAGGSKSASEALTKALLGERESMKTLGIAILESDVNLRVARNGQEKLTGTALKMARAQATVQIITEQAKNSIGDYARTADSAANSQKRAEENTKKLQVALGTYLNPAVTLSANLWSLVSGALSEVITKSNELRDADKAEKQGNATLEQRLLLVQEQKRVLIATTDATVKAAKARGIDTKAIEDRTTVEVASFDAQIAGMKRFQDAVKKGEKTQAEADALAKKNADEKALRDEAEKVRLEGIAKAEQDRIDLIKELQALNYGAQTAEEAGYVDILAANFGKYSKALVDTAEKQRAFREQLINTGLSGAVGAIGAMTEALVLGEDGWDAFAQSGLNAIASIIEAIGAMLIASAAKEIALAGFFNPLGWAASASELGWAAAAYTAAGAVRGYAGTFEDGGIIPGSSYSGDKLIASVNSGEEVVTANDRQTIKDALNNQQNQVIEIHNYTVLDSKVIAKSVTRQQRNNKA